MKNTLFETDAAWIKEAWFHTKQITPNLTIYYVQYNEVNLRHKSESWSVLKIEYTVWPNKV